MPYVKKMERLSIEEKMLRMPCHGNEGIDMLRCRNWECFQCGFNPKVHLQRVAKIRRGQWVNKTLYALTNEGREVETIDVKCIQVPRKLTKEEVMDEAVRRQKS